MAQNLLFPLSMDDVNPPRTPTAAEFEWMDKVFGTPQQWVNAIGAPTARVTDPQTSHLAAASAKDLQADHHCLILGALASGPAGKDRIATITKLTGVQVCRRLVELQRARAIRPTGKTVASDSGRQEREWERA